MKTAPLKVSRKKAVFSESAATNHGRRRILSTSVNGAFLEVMENIDPIYLWWTIFDFLNSNISKEITGQVTNVQQSLVNSSFELLRKTDVKGLVIELPQAQPAKKTPKAKS